MWPAGASFGPPQPSRFYQSTNHSSTSNFNDFRSPHPARNERPRGKRGRLRAKQSDYSFYSDRESFSDNSTSMVTRTVARGAHRGTNRANVFNVALQDIQSQNTPGANTNNYDRQLQNAQDTNRNNYERQHMKAQDTNRNSYERQHQNEQNATRNNYERQHQNEQNATRNQERQNRSDHRRNGRTEPRASRDDENIHAKLYVCPKCDNNYSVRSGQKGITGKVPLILNCNHTVCQECIYKTIINSKVTCPVCNKPSTLSQEPPDISQVDLQTVFLPNYYIIGIMSCNRPQNGNLNNLDNVKFVSTTTAKKNKAPAQPIERCSFNQCSKKATMFCPSCEAIYCIDCCTVIHKSINKLVSHEPVPYKKAKFTLVLDKCKEHKEMNVEFYCKDCDIKACCYCVLDTHTDHEREPLSKLSDLEMIEFTSLKKDAEKVLKELLICQKKASNLTSYSTDTVRKEIRDYFADLHATISSIENKLHKEVEEFQAAIGNLNPIQASLCQSIDMLKQLVAIDHKTCKDVKMNLKGALEKLRDVSNIPRFLLNENGNSDPIRFTVDSGIFDSLESAFDVEKCENSQYRLVTENELDDDYVLENDPEIETELQEIINKSEQLVLSEENSSPSTSRKPSKNLQKYTKPKDQKYNSGNMGKITVQHINSMESFYIQYKNDEPKLQQLNSDIENYIKMGGAESVEEFQLNQLYLALYIADYQKDKDVKWCRARLIDIIKVDETNTYDMFFIDYGKSQVVEANRIKDMPAFLAAKRPFAIHCSLHNPLGVNWNKNSHFALARILNGKDICMVVKNVENGIHDVDLMLASSDGNVTSVIDILVHATHSVAPANDDNSSLDELLPPKKGAYFPELKVFPNSAKFVKNQSEKVTIANIVDPYHIFVHVVAYQETFKSTLKSIKKAYRQSKAQGCVPIEGTYVMVEHKDPVRSNYHRAFIKSADLLNDKVYVQLVDWGVSVVVGSAQIKPLPQNLTRLECQAVLIKLTDIAPYNKQTTWSPVANRVLETYYRSQEVLKMIVHYVTPEFEVALFDITRNVDVCLNAMMVENNLADSTGYVSTQLEWSPLKPENVKYSEEDGLLSSLLKKVDCSDKESEGSDDEADNSNVTRRPLDIIKVESPEAIFVKFIELRERDSNMFKELQIHYSESQEKKDNWNVEDLCVAELEKEFSRGKIVEEKDGEFLVSLYDKGTEVMLPREKLYVYSTYFNKFPPVALKSHLCNVTPAGDTGKWSNSSIESLQEILSKHTRIYGTILKEHSDCFNKSVPMELWYGVVVRGGPLDADKLKYVSINNILVKLGFAYRKQPKPINMAKDGEGLLKSLMVTEEKTEKIESNDDPPSIFEDAPNEDKATKSWVDLVENELGTLDRIQEKQTNQEMQPEISLQKIENITDDWLPPYRLGKKEFEARVTCVETGGHMYLREDRLEKVYQKLEENMKLYFERNPPTLNNDKWQPGQLCTIKYTDDNWYRGKVLRVKSPKEITVFMIDFGSDHDLPPEVLFRELLYTEYRCFAVKVKLDKIYSKQPTWLSSDYDHFHELVTDWCRIVVQGPLDVELPLVDVYNSNDVYVNQKLVEICPNLSRCSNFPTELSSTEEESIVIESIEVNEDPVVDEDMIQRVLAEFDVIDYIDDYENLTYKIQPIPKELLEGKKLIMEIGGILNYDKVALKLPGEDDSAEMYDLAIDLQESVSKMPPLKEFKVGTPCLAQFSEDKVWYRAVISNADLLDSGFVSVFYVDYGNSESTSIKNLRKIKRDLLNLPQQCWEAFLNIKLVDESQVMSVEQAVNSLDRKKRYVKLVKENPVTVDLYDKNDELCFENLKKSGILNSKE
ncbi:RING finger protein 17 isoform X2 [Sitophilus oryzae]|uniref:RING finger protein 17 isoform X2 n=1 Tax=Sitophilus oryzae TaxID=7048 RepID=A0A6J2Y5J4_SITOR|nr:RING finger protein 17 isoform X2 [Sitophilus oryzae]